MTDCLSPLRLARLKKGYSQQGLSILSGIPQVALSYAERGYENALRPDQWQRIAEILETTPDKLRGKS
jgi:transcriptional regulator with XRE-family HTH domain